MPVPVGVVVDGKKKSKEVNNRKSQESGMESMSEPDSTFCRQTASSRGQKWVGPEGDKLLDLDAYYIRPQY